MTAFAQGEHKDTDGTLRCEVRAVNHRYLDISLQLPDALKVLEQPVREAVRGQVQRGKITLTLNYEREQPGADQLNIDEGLVSAYIQSCKMIAGRLENPTAINPVDILRCPGVLNARPDLPGDLQSQAMTLVKSVLDIFVENRLREGDALKAVMLERVAAIAGQVDEIERAVPEIRIAQEQRLRKRLADLDLDAHSERLEQELVFQAQRLDVDEEIDRLRTHLSEMKMQLDKDEPIGRRLDFLAQELNREANTLASKSQGVASSQGAIEIKVCIEQIREQIQNIE